MAHNLKDIESLYESAIISQADRLLSTKAVKEHPSSEKDVFTFDVKDSLEYKVVIKHPFTKKQSLTCQCEEFGNKNLCVHVVASLIFLRDRSEKDKTTKKKPSRRTTLSVKNILESVEFEELKAFAIQFAKTNKKFATQLKVNFARKVDLDDNEEKYKIILDSIIRPVTGKEHQASLSEVKALCQVLEDFYGQINDSIAMEQYREAFNIFKAAFSKLEYTRCMFPHHQDILKELSRNYHHLIDYFLANKLPAPLKSDINRFLSDMVQRSYYLYDDFSSHILHKYIHYFKKAERLLPDGFPLILLHSRPVTEHPVIMAFDIKISGKVNKETEELLKSYPLQILNITDLLISHAEWKSALKVIEKSFSPKQRNVKIYDRLILIYSAQKDFNNLRKSIITAFEKSGKTKYLDVAQDLLPEEEYDVLTSEIESHILSSKLDDYCPALNFYRYEGDWAGMVIYLEKHGNIDILKKYDDFIYKNDLNAILDLYKQYLRPVLEQQIGVQSFSLLNELRQHWNGKEMHKLTKDIRDFLKKEFEHRPKLYEILS